jgi:hypothetical protein
MADMALVWRGSLLGLLVSTPFELAACTRGSWGAVNREIWNPGQISKVSTFSFFIPQFTIEVPVLVVLVLEAFYS